MTPIKRLHDKALSHLSELVSLAAICSASRWWTLHRTGPTRHSKDLYSFRFLHFDVSLLSKYFSNALSNIILHCPFERCPPVIFVVVRGRPSQAQFQSHLHRCCVSSSSSRAPLTIQVTTEYSILLI